MNEIQHLIAIEKIRNFGNKDMIDFLNKISEYKVDVDLSYESKSDISYVRKVLKQIK